MLKTSLFKICLCLSITIGLTTNSNATLIEIQQNNDIYHGYDSVIKSNDLINNGQTSLDSLTATGGFGFPASGSNDGTSSHTSGLTYGSGSALNLLFTLNTDVNNAGSAFGYNIDGINSIYGWQDSRYRHAAQHWTVSISTILVPTLTELYTVNYSPFYSVSGLDHGAGSTLVSLTNIDAKNVTAINFNMVPTLSAGTHGYTGEIGVLNEFDVFGTASSSLASTPSTNVPEPSTLAIFALGMIGLASRRFKKQS